MTGRASAGPPQGLASSRSACVLVTFRESASSIARWIVVFPDSFAPRTTVRPGASATIQRGVPADVVQAEARDPHRVTSLPDSRSRPSRSTSRISRASSAWSAASSSATRRLDGPDERTRDRVVGRQRSARQRARRKHRGCADLRKEAATPASTSSTSRSSSSGRTPVRRTSSTRSGSAEQADAPRTRPGRRSLPRSRQGARTGCGRRCVPPRSRSAHR